jgi:hypothetical protein
MCGVNLAEPAALRFASSHHCTHLTMTRAVYERATAGPTHLRAANLCSRKNSLGIIGYTGSYFATFGAVVIGHRVFDLAPESLEPGSRRP